MTTLDKIHHRLSRAGIDTRRDYISTPDGAKPVLIALHDYTGPYPGRDTRDKIAAVDRACNGLPVVAKRRGYYQATYITEKAVNV